LLRLLSPAGGCSPAAMCGFNAAAVSRGNPNPSSRAKQMGLGQQFEGKKTPKKQSKNLHCEATTLGFIQLPFQPKAQGSAAFPAGPRWTPHLW